MVCVSVCVRERARRRRHESACNNLQPNARRPSPARIFLCMYVCARETSTLLYYSSLVGLLCHTHYLIRAQVQFIIQLSIRCVVHVLKPQSAYIRKLSQHSHQTLVLFLDWHRVPTNCDSFSLWMPESINESFCS